MLCCFGMQNEHAVDKWAEQEFGQALLGDQRRTARAVAMAKAIAAHPSGLLTQVFAKSDEREAAFRFVRNDDISPSALMDAAHSRTALRCAEHPFVFVAVDQTDLSIVDNQRTKVLGDTGTAGSRGSGLQVVNSLAVSPDGVPLGLLSQQYWTRLVGKRKLVDEPELLYAIACAVRAAVPASIPFTAKMRLGVSDTAKALDCARALAAGGVAGLVVHARTKADAYRPPAHWEWVGLIADVVSVPVVANGEVWNEDDWRRCRSVSGAADVMLGRGAVADPFLVRRIRQGGEAPADRDAEWAELLPLIGEFWQRVLAKVEARHAPGRLKQWLKLLRRNFPQGEILYAAVRAKSDVASVSQVLAAHGIPFLKAAA